MSTPPTNKPKECTSCAQEDSISDECQCVYCKKTFCEEDIIKVVCDCILTPLSFHCFCNNGDLVCHECLDIMKDDIYSMVHVNKVVKVIKMEREKSQEKDFEIARLKNDIEWLKTEHRIHMDVYHSDTQTKKRKTKE